MIKVKEELKKSKVITEDTGKEFEMAICLLYDIKFNGKYNYTMENPEKIKQRMKKLLNLFPKCKHNGNKSQYDFTSLNDEKMHLSAKTTKKGIGKVAPQVIGQVKPEKFCEIIDIPYTNNKDLKEYIQNNILKILPFLVKNTFMCPNLYYNKHEDTIRYITLKILIVWDNYKFDWTNNWKVTGSSTLRIHYTNKPISLIEFQFHNNRPNMAIRWCYENFLKIFELNLDIINI